MRSFLLIFTIIFIIFAQNKPRLIGPTSQFSQSTTFKAQEYSYFIFGFAKNSPTMEYKNEVKILLSMRFRFFNLTYDSTNVLVEFNNCVKKKTIYKNLSFDIGYRQKSLWNIYDDSTSRPIYDNNYSPSFYFTWTSFIASLPASLLAGYIHESNGGSTFLNIYCPAISRSWDRIYLGLSLGNLQTNPTIFQLDLWIPFGLEENPEMYKHYGVGEMTFLYQPLFRSQYFLANFGISTAWKIATENLNNIEIGVFISPFQFTKKILNLFTPTFYAQLYVGSGENLINYQDRHTSFRVGLATLY
jgi:outer membrane phospholipase A